MDVIRAVLPENWFVVAFLVASGVVSFAIFVGLRRLGSRRTVLYVYGLASAVAVVLAFRIGGRISTTDVWKSLLLVVYVQGFLFGGLIWRWQGEVSGGPELREEAGLPQYEGHDRAYWTARLTFSPLHVVRYQRHMIHDPSSLSRVGGERREGGDAAGPSGSGP